MEAQASSHAWHLEFTSKNPQGVSRPLGRPLRVPRSSHRGRQASLADVALHGALTPAAGDVATPVVLAVAPLYHTVCVGVVATSTAHEVAAVTAMGCLVALPGGREWRLVSTSVTPTPVPHSQAARNLPHHGCRRSPPGKASWSLGILNNPLPQGYFSFSPIVLGIYENDRGVLFLGGVFFSFLPLLNT